MHWHQGIDQLWANCFMCCNPVAIVGLRVSRQLRHPLLCRNNSYCSENEWSYDYIILSAKTRVYHGNIYSFIICFKIAINNFANLRRNCITALIPFPDLLLVHWKQRVDHLFRYCGFVIYFTSAEIVEWTWLRPPTTITVPKLIWLSREYHLYKFHAYHIATER